MECAQLMDSDWASLPKHLLASILERLESLKDYLQCITVCSSWHSKEKNSQSKCNKNLRNHHVPMLLIPSKRNRRRTWSMYSILDYKFLESKLLLPWYGGRFGGSSEGWLVTVDENLAVTLYKPFAINHKKSDAIIHLPPLLPSINDELNLERYVKFREYYVYKVATFMPDPVANPNDIIIVVIFGDFKNLAYIRPVKDTIWRLVNGKDRLYVDVVYNNDQFYAITNEGKLASFKATNPLKWKLKLAPIDQVPRDDTEEAFCYKHYLVESYGGELLVVNRYNSRYTIWLNRDTNKFKVFKLSLDRRRWIEVKDLGDVALFLGDNTSICVLASSFIGCQRNCIYFTQDFLIGSSGPLDFGVYNLESGSVRRYFTIDPANIAKIHKRVLIWVEPTPNI